MKSDLYLIIGQLRKNINITKWLVTLAFIILVCAIIFQCGRLYQNKKNAEIICMKAMKGNFSHWTGNDIVCDKNGVKYKIGYRSAKKFT